MSANRLVDRFIDAANPRTAGRHLPRGSPGARRDAAGRRRVRRAPRSLAAWMLNPLCLALAPLAPRLPGRLLLHEALHVALALDPRLHRRHRGRRRLDRGARALRPARVRALVRAHGLDRRLRPDLRLPGRGVRPARGAPLVPRPLRDRARAASRPGLPRADGARASRALGWHDRARLALLGRLARRGGPPRLRALARLARAISRGSTWPSSTSTATSR